MSEIKLSEDILESVDLAVQSIIGDEYPFSTSVEDFRELLRSVELTLKSVHQIDLFDEIAVLEYILEKYLVTKSAIRVRQSLISILDNRNKKKNHRQCDNTDTSEDETSNIVVPDRIKYLLSIPQPEQKSQAWLDQRQNYITASVFGDACGLKGPVALVTLLLNKVSQGKFQPFFGNKATQWGEKYEDVANMIYCHRNKTQVYEFGMIEHPDLKFLGASTDGISAELINIEIKCPFSRFITGITPQGYWAQTQLQMATLDLEKTHFLECSLQEYPTEEDFYTDFEWIEKSMEEIPVKGDQVVFRRPPPPNHHLEKGLLIEAVDLDQKNLAGHPKTIYFYSPIRYYLDQEKLKRWRNDKLREIINSDHLVFTRVIPWVLVRLSCVEINRDQDWFDAQVPILTEFWNDVEYYRKQNLTLDQIKCLKDKLVEKYISFGQTPTNSNSSSCRSPSSRSSSSRSRGTSPKNIKTFSMSGIQGIGCMLTDSDDEDVKPSSGFKKSPPSKRTPMMTQYNKFSGCLLGDDDELPSAQSSKKKIPSNKSISSKSTSSKSISSKSTSSKSISMSTVITPSKCLLIDSDDESDKPNSTTIKTTLTKTKTSPKQNNKPRKVHQEIVNIPLKKSPNHPTNKSPIRNKVCLL